MAKKKSIDLSKLIKQYDIKNDIDPTNQYGLGSFLKDNAGGLLKTAAGAALTATGAGAPMGIGMMASGATDIASKELARTPEEEVLMQTAGGIGGQIGAAQMAQGGELTQYNGGGTHEQNPNGGIDIGNNQVEDKETRWEDYIFSERINIPGKKYSFAEASKKIDKRYKRENDPYEKKAKEKEMKALMSMQEMEREKMNAAHNAAMQKAFGGPTDGEQDNLINTDGKMVIPQDTITGNSSRANDLSAKFGQQNQNAINITPGTQSENILPLSPRQSELTEKYEYLAGYKPNIDESGTKILGTDNVSKRKAELDAQELAMRKSMSRMLNLPTTEDGLPDYTKIDPNTVFDKSLIGENKLKKFYDVLYEKQAIRDAQGFQRKKYYGEKEASQLGYSDDTPLEDLNLGIRFLTGVQNPQLEQKAYGGKMKKAYGSGLVNRYESDFVEMPTPEDVNLEEALSFNKPIDSQLENAPIVDPMGAKQQGDNKFGQAAMFGAQNMGNIYNLIKGSQGAEQVDLGQINPQKYDYSKAIKNAEDRYSSAANQARETIRKTATGSGQALSNLIAAETSLAGGKERATRDIMQQQENQNTGLANQAEQYNLSLTNQENQINSQNEAMKDQFLAQGLSGIGSNIAQFSRDQRADKMQQGYIENLLKTGNYEIDPATGKVRLIGSNTQG